MSAPRALSLVGSTGSIGTQAIEVVRASKGALRVAALGANSSVDALAAQALELHPEVVAIGDASLEARLKGLVGAEIEVRAGPGALQSLAQIGDVVLNAVVGFAGLPVTIDALTSGRRLALANKESLIAGAPVVQRARATSGAEIVPVDSEHCAIHQCLGEKRHLGPSSTGFDTPPRGRAGAAGEVARLILTASGGPFRGKSAGELARVSIQDALAHPTWTMGPKITIDSSTLMNKGLEVIEAHELFGIDYDEIEVVVHPQSIVHSMVEFRDGATIAQLSHPDMRLPIGYAICYPERFATAYGSIDWRQLSQLDFDVPDLETFSCLALAYAAGRIGKSAPACLNAANEIAVEAFFAGRIAWIDIAAVVEETLSAHQACELACVEDVLEVDAASRRLALRAVEGREVAA